MDLESTSSVLTREGGKTPGAPGDSGASRGLQELVQQMAEDGDPLGLSRPLSPQETSLVKVSKSEFSSSMVRLAERPPSPGFAFKYPSHCTPVKVHRRELSRHR